MINLFIHDIANPIMTLSLIFIDNHHANIYNTIQLLITNIQQIQYKIQHHEITHTNYIPIILDLYNIYSVIKNENHELIREINNIFNTYLYLFNISTQKVYTLYNENINKILCILSIVYAHKTFEYEITNTEVLIFHTNIKIRLQYVIDEYNKYYNSHVINKHNKSDNHPILHIKVHEKYVSIFGVNTI